MRILVTGASGQVGGELAKLLPAHGEVIAADRASLDLSNPDEILKTMRETRPDIVVNAGAYTAVDLAERAGLYHLSSTGSTTWHGFARAIVGGAGGPRVTPIATSEYPTPARRPAYGVLATAKFERAFGFGLPAWQESLSACLREERGPERRTEP
jgi:dTDP-4-dehydrorhamnose reductase